MHWHRVLALFAFALPGLLSGQQPGGDLSQLAAGAQKVEDRAYEEAVGQLKGLADRLPKIGDYPRFYLGSAYFELENHAAALAVLAPIHRDKWDGLTSPFLARSVMLSANALVEMGKPKDAVALIRQHAQKLPQPNREIGLAKAFEAAGEDIAAAGHYQAVYYGFPLWERIDEAAEGIARLRARLGDRFPPVMPHMILVRAKALSDARRTGAKAELEAALPSLTGAERDLAQVRLGVADYQGRRYPAAYSYLKNLTVSTPEAGAERLYYLVESCRRLSRQNEIPGLLSELAANHPKSPFRFEALVNVAYDHLYRNEPAGYRPLYRDCADGFPDQKQAGFCHWKITWDHYLHSDSDKEEVLKAHLKQFPESEKAPASLYFLGRLAERRQSAAIAKAYYQEISYRFPNHYYAVLSRIQLEGGVKTSAAAPEVADFVASLNLPAKRRSVSFEPQALTKRRLERVNLLSSGGLDKWAEDELRFGARNDPQPQVLAVELAKMLDRRGASDEALRAVKGYVPDYLMYPMEEAPAEFWRVAFPMPFREPLLRNARISELDPFVVAGLVRQESEFNPKAISRSNALGLTQVLPSTGRELSRRTGLQRFSSAMLFDPETNLRLGTFYMRQLLNSFNGKWEQALASYNGGRSRVLRWEEWASYSEPAEFIESIPIQETRDYVQIVMRNATVYRQLYQGLPLEVRSTNEPARTAAAAKKPAAQKLAQKSPAARKQPGRAATATRKVPQPKNTQLQ